MEYLLEWLLQIWDFMANFMPCLIRTGCIMRNIVLHIHIFLTVALIALVSVGCRDRHAAELLARADAVMETAPDSAHSLLKFLNPAHINHIDEKAYYALLKTECDIKLDIPIESDSLIFIATTYYTRTSPESFDCMRALFYQSQVLNALGRASKSMTYVIHAYELAKHQEDPYWIAKTAEQMGMMYDSFYNDSLSRRYAEEAARYYLHAGKILNHRYALADIIPTIVNQKRYSDAIELGDSLLGVLTDASEDRYLKDYILRKQLPAYVDAGLYTVGVKCLRELEDMNLGGPGKVRQYLCSAQLMSYLGNDAEAREYLDKAASSISSQDEKSLFFYTLSRYYASIGQFPESMAMTDSVAALQSRFIGDILSTSISVEESDYYREVALLQETRSTLWRNRMYAGILIGVIVLGAAICIYYQKLRRKEEQLRRDGERLQDATEQIMELSNMSSMLRDTLEEREKILGELRKEVSSLGIERERLEEKLDSANRQNPSIRKHTSDYILDSMFDRQCRIINKICSEYKAIAKSKQSGGSTTFLIHSNNIETILRRSFSPKFLKEMESVIDNNRNNVIHRLRKSGIAFSGEELTIILLENSGFNIAVVASVLGCSVSAVYKKKGKMQERIKEAGTDLEKEFLELLGTPNRGVQ